MSRKTRFHRKVFEVVMDNGGIDAACKLGNTLEAHSPKETAARTPRGSNE